MTNDRIIKTYERDLIDSGKNEKTIKDYMDMVTFVVETLPCEVSEATPMDVKDIRSALIDRAYADTTYNKKIAGIRAFFSFIIQMKINDKCFTEKLVDNTFKSKKISNREEHGEEAMDVELFQPFYNFIFDINSTVYAQRKKVAMLLMITTGLRRFEVSELMISAVDLDNACIDPNATKFNKGRSKTLPIQPEIVDEIKLLLSLYKEHGIESEYLFATKTGKHVGENKINVWANNVSDMAIRRGLLDRRYPPHSLRKSFATYLYHVLGRDLNQIADILGHSDINTTRIYVSTNTKEKAQAMANLGLRR